MAVDKGKRKGDIDAERAVLGSMLLNNEVADGVQAIVREADFVTQRHRSIFKAITSTESCGSTTDVQAVADQLGRSEHFGGTTVREYLIILLECAAHSSNAAVFARIVRRASDS